MLKKLRSVASALLTVALAILIAGHWPKSVAATQKRVYIPVARLDQPIAVTEVTLAGAVVQKGRFERNEPEQVTPFDADENWIQKLTFSLVNRTGKTIVMMQVLLSFPDTTNGRSRVAVGLQFGCAPIDLSGNPKSCPERFSVAPGGVVPIRLADSMDRIKRKVEFSPSAIPLAAMTTIDFHVPSLWFDDGMNWTGSEYRAFDATTHSWQLKPPDFFPGDRHVYWPTSTSWQRVTKARGQ